MLITKPQIIDAELAEVKNINDSYIDASFKMQSGVEVNILPGQFIMIKTNNNGINIPSYCFQNNNNGFELVLKKDHPLALEIINFKRGNSIRCLMPLGRTFAIDNSISNLIFISEDKISYGKNLVKKLLETNNNKKITIVLFFDNAENIYSFNEYKKNSNITIIILSKKKNALINYNFRFIDYLKTIMLEKYDWVHIAINKNEIKEIDEFLSKNNINGNILYEEYIACGFGVCNGCTVIKKNNTIQKCCLNPYFKFGEIKYE